MNNWKETILGDVAKINELTVDKNFSYSKIEYIDITSVEERGIKQAQELNLSDAPSRAKRIIRENDILISTVRPNLKHFCFVKNAKRNSIASTGFAVITAKKADPYFLYYLLTTNEYTNYLIKVADSQTSTYPAFNPNIIERSKFLMPPIEEQKQISAVLSSLDDKIDLLRKQNETLEKIAQGIFKEWFVNFTIDGKKLKLKNGVPEGWRIGKVDDLCERLNSGGTPSTKNTDYYNGNINWFSTKELQDKFLFDSEKKITDDGLKNSSTKLFPAGSVLMAIYAAPTVGRLGILTKESAFNQAACGFVANEKVTCGEFIYLFLFNSRDNFNNLSNGAAQQNLSVGLVKNHPIIIPQAEIMDKFKKIIQPQFKKILNNSTQIQTLSRLRDTLLPKLMRGDVKVE